MTENTGYYAIVGSPKKLSTPSIKYMKYAVLINACSIRILLIQNTKVALEVSFWSFLIVDCKFNIFTFKDC